MKMSVRTSFSSGRPRTLSRRPPASAFTRRRGFIRGRGKNRVWADAVVRPRRHGRPCERISLPPLPLSLPPLPPSLPPPLPPLDCPRGCRAASARTRKREKKFTIYNLQFSVFGFQSPKSPSSPSSLSSLTSLSSPSSPSSSSSPCSPRSPRSAGEAARRRRFFWPSSPSQPSKLYSSLGWLNSKVLSLSLHSL
jgi:hypothetical protein